MKRIANLLLMFALALVSPLTAQWTVKPGGWFTSIVFDKGTIPDRFTPDAGATKNGLDKTDVGIYFIYGLAEGVSIGMGQGFAHLEDNHNGVTTTTTGFGATGFFVLKRITQGKAGVLSVQARTDVPLLYNRDARPVLGPVKAEGDLRVLYGTGYGIGSRRGFLSAAFGGSAWRHGDNEIRYDATLGLDAGANILLLAQTFNVAGLADGGGLDYSATKVGGAAVWHVTKAVGIVAGYFAGISGKNTARERTGSLGVWISHEPKNPAAPQIPH